MIGRATRTRRSSGLPARDPCCCDTPAHADYFARSGVNRDRFRVLWLGAQEDVFQPQPDVAPVPNLVVFHGTFVPLQGLATIVHAAKLLEPDGSPLPDHRRAARSAHGRPRGPRRDLDARNIELSDACRSKRCRARSRRLPLSRHLRHLRQGRTRRAEQGVRVPAAGRPIVTADTPAIRSAFSGEVATVPTGNAQALAQEIRALLVDPARLATLAGGGARAIPPGLQRGGAGPGSSQATSTGSSGAVRRRRATARGPARSAEASSARASRATEEGDRAVAGLHQAAADRSALAADCSRVRRRSARAIEARTSSRT